MEYFTKVPMPIERFDMDKRGNLVIGEEGSEGDGRMGGEIKSWRLIWRPHDNGQRNNGFKFSFELTVEEPEKINLLRAKAKVFISTLAGNNQVEKTVRMIFEGQIEDRQNVYPPLNDNPIIIANNISIMIEGTLTIYYMRPRRIDNLRANVFQRLCTTNENAVSTVELNFSEGHKFIAAISENAESEIMKMKTKFDVATGISKENTFFGLLDVFYSNISKPEDEHEHQDKIRSDLAKINEIREGDKEISFAFEMYKYAKLSGLTTLMEFCLATIYEGFPDNYDISRIDQHNIFFYLKTNQVDNDDNIQNMIDYLIEIFQFEIKQDYSQQGMVEAKANIREFLKGRRSSIDSAHNSLTAFQGNDRDPALQAGTSAAMSRRPNVGNTKANRTSISKRPRTE